MRRLLVIFFLITGCAHRGSIVSPTTEIPGWKKQALERIELVRKAPFTLFVRDAEGNPVPHARIVKRVWTTKKEIIADDSGRATFEGFFGTYEASVSRNGNESSQMITFKRGAARTLTLRDRRAAR